MQSKKQSLNKIICDVAPDVVALCETKRSKELRRKQDDIPGFEVVEKNVKKGKEGMLIAVRQGTFQSIDEVSSAEFDNIFVVRVEYKSETIRFVMVHSPQETDPTETRSSFYEEVKVQVERCDMAGDKLVLLGDFNARLMKADNKVVAMSENGKLLCEVVNDNDLQVVNFEPVAQGEWTRIQAKNGSVVKSTLDYIMVKDPALVSEMVIDEDKIYCPYRETTSKNTQKITFSDHCAILLTIDAEAVNVKPYATGTNFKAWNFTEDGYSTYKIESIEAMEVKWSPDINQAYTFWTEQFENLLSRCFTKKTVKSGPVKSRNISNQNKSVRNILASIAKKGKIQRSVVKLYMERLIELEVRKEVVNKTIQLKKTMANLTEEEKFSPNGYWKLKKAADNNLKRESVYNVIKENGSKVSGQNAINLAYKEEFSYRLRTRKPHAGWEEYVDELNQVVRDWLSSDSSSSPPFTMEELDKVIDRLRKGKSPGLDGYPPEVFIHAGPGVRLSLLQLLNQVKESRDIPEQWNLVKIVTIYKKKGSKSLLKNYRGIFLALVISKIFESLIKERIEPNLKQINVLQAGARSNRGPADQLFLVRGCMDHYVAMKQPLYITTYDYEQAFDSLWVEKCVLALKNLEVPKEMLQLIYNLNKKAEVIVKTPFGFTDAFTTEPIVKQGTVLGPILCSGSTGEYCGRNEGVPVGDMTLSSLLFVDDVLDMTETEVKRVRAHEQAVIFTKENNLSLSGTKCYCLAMNNGGNLPEPMVIDGNKKVTPCHEIVYLGDVFDDKGTNEGLIRDRIARGTKAMICIESLVRETNLGVYEVSVWLLLYRSLFLATVLFNSQTWSRLTDLDIQKLEKMQMKMLKKILHLPSSLSNSFLLLELGVMPISGEIHKRQLTYLHRVLSLPEEDPVADMFRNMMVFEEAGERNWWSEVKPLLPRYGLPEDLELVKNISKESFKRMVNKGVQFVCTEQLKRECSGLKKTSELRYDGLQMQQYLKEMYPTQAKIILQARSGTLDIKTQNSYKFEDLICRKCGEEVELLDHVLNCGYDDEFVSSVLFSNGEDSCELISQLTRTANRIQMFYDDVTMKDDMECEGC